MASLDTRQAISHLSEHVATPNCPIALHIGQDRLKVCEIVYKNNLGFKTITMKNRFSSIKKLRILRSCGRASA